MKHRPKLVQAADPLGQLAIHVSRKANALYCEFEEIGITGQLGYSSPADIIDKFPAFSERGSRTSTMA